MSPEETRTSITCSRVVVNMIPINACKFVTDLMLCLTSENGIVYAPDLTCKFLSSICINENTMDLIAVAEVASAVNKISWFEQHINDEEYRLLLPNIGYSQNMLTAFFEESINPCYFPENSPFSAFNFLRYLAYVTRFSILSYMHGSKSALDFACWSIMRIINKNPSTFREITTWLLLVSEAERINLYDFVHPGLTWVPPHHFVSS